MQDIMPEIFLQIDLFSRKKHEHGVYCTFTILIYIVLHIVLQQLAT